MIYFNQDENIMNSFMKFAAIILMAAMSPAHAAEGNPVITVMEQAPSTPIVILVTSIYDFEKEISVRVRKDPRFIPTDVLIETVSEYVMTDAKGIIISSGYEIDVEHDLVIGFSGGSSEIINTAITPQGLQVISNFRDANGHFVTPPQSNIAMYNTSGDRLCFDYENATAASPDISITLLLDRSGSMLHVIDDVKNSANGFLDLLPPSANCAVASFNDTWRYGHSNFLSCNDGGFGFENITASGGTDIYAPLKDAYQKFSQPEFASHQKAAIIITDGYTLKDSVRKAELLNLKNDVVTLVYLIGGNQRNELEGLTDHFIAHSANTSQSISAYLQTISQIYNSQKVLTVKSCRVNAL